MAPSKAALDLNAMISKDRQRRKNETLANEIFGNRRASAPGVLNKRNNKSAAVPSLASRIGPIGGGVAKRTMSTSTRPAASRSTARPAGNVDAEWTHDLHTFNNPPVSKFSQGPPRGPKAAAARTNRNERIHSALHNSASSPALNSQFNIVGTAKPAPGISIRGLAGPSMVMIKNLALGTTVADIESAMTPVGGTVLNCRIISEKPKVIAELVFETKEGADNVVDTFNNQNADGHLLQVYHKSGPLPTTMKQLAPASPAPRSNTPQGPRADRNTDRSGDTRSGYSDDRYAPRERSRERRRDFGREDVMDGSYGFNDDRMETDEEEGKGLYSDNLLSSRGRAFTNNRDRGGRGDRNRSYR
ncbi:hypothetical protein ONS95_013188 [Cadophora gregata]|uniref:uncharacterized protein n=1 Tax=Cadophora gregata TaxID=51156 RepID=UPI0026DB2C36|nr:uncharacterized protein ONS95_013188 [Cadophora gregata]KAK0099994.1 hypothetical protein ONS96_007937 [Cadophora gregata f. sp. sojae]KAK0116158.1 hypothetical protein ONS95_013188 [Cadophora gregata]